MITAETHNAIDVLLADRLTRAREDWARAKAVLGDDREARETIARCEAVYEKWQRVCKDWAAG